MKVDLAFEAGTSCMCSKRLPTGVIPHSHLGILLTTPRINKQNLLADLGVRASLGGGFLAPLACVRVILGDAFSEVIEHSEVLLRRANPWVACVCSAYRSAVEMSIGGKTGACPEGRTSAARSVMMERARMGDQYGVEPSDRQGTGDSSSSSATSVSSLPLLPLPRRHWMGIYSQSFSPLSRFVL
jgi:hypothetical protein